MQKYKTQKCKHTGRGCAELQIIDYIYSNFLVFNLDYVRQLIFYVENFHKYV